MDCELYGVKSKFQFTPLREGRREQHLQRKDF